MAGKISSRVPRGEGSFRLTPTGRIEYRISYKDDLGKRRQKAFTGDSEAECLARAEEFLYWLDRGREGIPVDATVAEIIRKKIETDFRKNYTGEQGYCRNLGTLKVIEKSIIGHMPIVQITEKQIDMFLSSITDYSNTMIGKIYSMMRGAFAAAYEEGIIRRNYMLSSNLRCPRSNKEDKKVRGLTEDEQRRFIEALEAWRVPKGRNNYKLQLQIELYGGLRMGEINALRPKDIDFKKGILRVERTVSRGLEYKEFIKSGTKTYAGRREVPINKNLESVLKEALAQSKSNPEGTLFYDYVKGAIITTSQVNCFYRRLCEKADIEYLGQHALRHTFATRCIEAGIPPVVLKTWLGHTNIHITLDTYSDVFDRMNFDSMDKFDAFMECL